MDAVDADDFEILGYIRCRCGHYMVDPGPLSTIVLCPDCRGALKARSDAGRLRYEAHGRTFTAEPRQRKKSGRPKHRPRLTAAQKEARRKRDRAKIRAYVRLAAIYRPMFDLLYAEEKLREGLDPTIRSAIPRPRAVEAELLRDLAEAEERDMAPSSG